MATARRSLGPAAWACLASSNAFHRTLHQIRQSMVPGGDKRQPPVSRGDRSPPPADAGWPHPDWAASSEKLAPGGGRRAKETQDRGSNPRVRQARKRGVLKGDGTEAKDQAREENGKGEEFASTGGGWDRRLSEQVALAVNAVMWTIATERERSTYCAAYVAQESDDTTKGAVGEIVPPANVAVHHQATEGTNTVRSRAAAKDSNPAATTDSSASLEELRVSLAAARRFIKSSRLIDGVCVLDADVDLAFKRREEVRRLAAHDQHCSVSVATTSRSPVRRGGAQGKVEASGTQANAMAPPAQKLCEAVGCSDAALYGGVHPSAKARLCRKHRRNGMVDVGSRR